MKTQTIVLVGFVGILLIGGLYFASSRKSNSSKTPGQYEQSQSPMIELGVDESETNALVADGELFTDPAGVYTVYYPSDYTVDGPDQNNVRMYKRAETVRPQGEISDGVLIVFESIDLAGKPLEELVDSRIEQATVNGTAELTQAKKATTFNGYPGFSYGVQGFGSSDYLVIQKDADSDSAVSITFLVADPQQLDYQSEVSAILSTLRFR